MVHKAHYWHLLDIMVIFVTIYEDNFKLPSLVYPRKGTEYSGAEPLIPQRYVCHQRMITLALSYLSVILSFSHSRVMLPEGAVLKVLTFQQVSKRKRKRKLKRIKSGKI